MEEVTVNNEAKLSEHFKLGEMIKTSVKGVDNTPSHAAVLNLKRLCEYWLEDLRYSHNALYHNGMEEQPIIINSGYRSQEVNERVGGAKNSNHLTGCAVDIHCENMQQAIRYASILIDIAEGIKQDFDELLVECNKKGSIWLHFAVRPKDNRMKIGFLKA